MVLFAVAKSWGGLRCFPERPVEAGGELDGVAEDGNPVAIAVVGKDLIEEENEDEKEDEEDLWTCLMARIRPSIMSEGATMSAPALAKSYLNQLDATIIDDAKNTCCHCVTFSENINVSSVKKYLMQ